MKKKFTIDADVLPGAKRCARSCGVSLSSFVERSLREVTDEEAPTFTNESGGRPFRAADSSSARGAPCRTGAVETEYRHR